jgi:hypothetical protein
MGQSKRTRTEIKQGGVSQCGLAIYIKRYLIKAKLKWQTQDISKNSNISPCKNIIFKKSFKRNQNPSRYYNSITNLKHKPKYHLSKILV